MIHFLPITLLALASAASSTPASIETWEFVYVSRSTSLAAHCGTALLKRTANTLYGTLQDAESVEYSIKLKLHGKSITGWFGAVESDDGGAELEGKFNQYIIPASDGSGCWQTIQLFDGSHSVTLARNVPQCSPN